MTKSALKWLALVVLLALAIALGFLQIGFAFVRSFFALAS